MQWPNFLRNFMPGTKPGKKPARRDDSAFAGTFGNGAPGGFAGAHISRLTASLASWSAGINADNDAALPILRARARQLAANNEYGKRFLTLVANNVVGRNNPQLQVRAYKDGPVATTAVQRVLDKPANDAVEIAWVRWGKTCDITGKHKSLPSFCRMVAKAAARDGEALIRKVRRRDLPFGFALQALEADRLDDALNQTLNNGNTIRQGVEIDSTGRAIAYWIKPSHPGENYGVRSTVAERVLAQDVIHLFMPERAEQVRGVTWFHAVILRNATIGRFEDAAVIAAEIGASKVAAIHKADDAPRTAGDVLGDGRSSNGLAHINVEPGEMFELPPGYSLSSWNPDYPHANFESFLKTCLRGLGTGYDVAAHNLTGDMTDVNYSSARIAELAERECWMALQDWFINSFVLPVYEDWLAIALLRGDITFEQSGKALPPEKFDKFFTASRFQGRRWAWVDPAKEMEANQLALNMRITSRTRIAAERGEDLDDILDELQQEEKMLADRNLNPPVAPAAPAAPQPPPTDNSKSDEYHANAAAHRELLGALAKSMQTPPTITVTPHITLGETRIDAHFAAAPAPSVEIHNDIHEREQPAPVVTVSPVVNVAAPEVTVEVEAIMPAQTEVAITSLPARQTTSQVQRDNDGNITNTQQIETDL